VAQSQPAAAAKASQAKPPAQMGLQPGHMPVRLGHVDDMGAFFLFEPALLLNEQFRLSFPQHCVACGASHKLQVHRVVWSAMLPGRGQFGVRTSFTPAVFELDKMRVKNGPEFLSIIGPIENMPEPYCLPMPYYVCGSCSAVGAIVTDVRTTTGSAQPECELGICSLNIAEDFARITSGQDCAAIRHIRQAVSDRGGDPWRSLPLAMQSRIRKWFRADKGERFVAFIADDEFAKTEAGMAGVVITDRRLISHKFASQVDMPLNHQMTISAKAKGAMSEVHIISSGGKHSVIALAKAGLERLRRYLSAQGVRTKWM
jgi:hypothetical protein